MYFITSPETLLCPPPQEYQFASDNPHRDEPDPLAEGQRRLACGDLPGAVLCFETAAQRQPDCALAWRLLGTSLAENEQVKAQRRRVLIESPREPTGEIPV